MILAERSYSLHRVHDTYPVHAISVVAAKQMSQRYQRFAAKVDLALNIVHRVHLDVVLLIKQMLVHDACAKEEGVVILGDHAVDQPAPLELRALGLGLGGRLDVRHAEELQQLLALRRGSGSG